MAGYFRGHGYTLTTTPRRRNHPGQYLRFIQEAKQEAIAAILELARTKKRGHAARSSCAGVSASGFATR